MPAFNTSPTGTGTVFDIYSIGDGLFMRRVMDSVAAMSNAGLLIDLFALSLILGLLIMAFRNVMAGGNKLELGTMLVSVILGYAFFGMKATVNIHDMNFAPGEVDQPTYVVANVPFGMAAAGWLISNVSYELTEKMETAYGLGGGSTTLIEGGFGNTLEWINSIRMWEVPAFNDDAGKVGLFKDNLGNYMISCVRPAIEMGHMKLDKLLTTTAIWTPVQTDLSGGIGYNSEYLMSKWDDGLSSSPEEMVTCREAFSRLNTARVTIGSDFADAYAKSNIETSTGGKSTHAAMEGAFASIGVNTSKMQDLIAAEAVGISLENAIRGQEMSEALDSQSKLMIEQASIQRATQWAAEETMFRRIMRPMMAFFETLMYALAPFMALMLGLGTYGIQTVAKYMMLSIWVALWMPVLSIIELYQVTMMQHAVAAMNMGLDGAWTSGGVTIGKAEALRAQAIDWLGTGSAMAAFTPAITMALVWGGAVTASALASQMRGGDTVNEKLAAPDVASPGAAVSVGSAMNHDRANAGVMSGWQQQIPSLEVGSAISNNASLTKQRMESTSATASSAVSQKVSEAIGHLRTVTGQTGTTHTGQLSTQDSGSMVYQQGEQRGNDSRVDSATAVNNAVAATQTQNFGGTASAGAGTPSGSPVSASAGANAGMAGSNSDTTSTSRTKRGVEGSGGGTTESAVNTRSWLGSDGQTLSEYNSLSAADQRKVDQMVSNDKTVQKAIAANEQASKAYSETSAVQQQYGMKGSTSVATLANSAVQNGKAGMNSANVASAGLKGLSDRYYGGAELQGIADAGQRRAAADIMALYEGASKGTAGGATSEQAAFRAQAFQDAVDQRAGSGTFYGGGVRPETGANLAPNAPSAGRVHAEAAAATGPNFNAGAMVAQSRAAISGDPGAVEATRASAQSMLPTNPGGHGSQPVSAGADAANVAADMAQPFKDGVRERAKQDLAAASKGMTADSMNRTAAIWSMDAADRIAGAIPGLSPEGSANQGHPLAQMRDAIIKQSHGMLSYADANGIAVARMSESSGSDSIPRNDLNEAKAWARTERGEAALARYGHKVSGDAAMEEDGRQFADGQMTGLNWDGYDR